MLISWRISKQGICCRSPELMHAYIANGPFVQPRTEDCTIRRLYSFIRTYCNQLPGGWSCQSVVGWLCSTVWSYGRVETRPIKISDTEAQSRNPKEMLIAKVTGQLGRDGVSGSRLSRPIDADRRPRPRRCVLVAARLNGMLPQPWRGKGCRLTLLMGLGGEICKPVLLGV